MGNVLILISCCNFKETRSTDRYNLSDSILSILHDETRLRIFRKRNEIFNLIKEGKIYDALRAGGNRKSNPYNKKLVNGPDLSVSFEEQPIDNFLPAYKRYKGRFFSEVGEDIFEESIRNDIHTLLLSSMYGLITLNEPIQLYGCFLGDNAILSNINFQKVSTKVKYKIGDLWIENKVSLIYETLIQYIEYHNLHNDHQINFIIDLLSEYYYQIPFQWNGRLNKWLQKKGITALHRVVSGIREPEFLPLLGTYYKEIIKKGKSYIPPPFKQPILESEDGVLSFEENIKLPEARFEDKLIRILTKEVWDKLEPKTRVELISGERLYELTSDWSLEDPNEPADRILHYFVAIENELNHIFGKTLRLSLNKKHFTLGEYYNHLKSGVLQDKLPLHQRDILCEKLDEFTKIRNKMPHIREAYRRHFDRARKIIFEDGILTLLAKYKIIVPKNKY
jgi:hypothetical protein